MMQSLKIVALAIVMLAYLYIPSSLIYRYEKISSEGTVFRFCPQPVDPYDAFRGRYVRLNLDIFRDIPFDTTERKQLQEQKYAYAFLKKDRVTCTIVDRIVANEPESGDYLKVILDSYSIYDDARTISVQPPSGLTTYFINEEYAKAAENAYSSLSRDDERTSVQLDVRILKGLPVIQELYFEGQPVIEYLKTVEHE